MRGWVSRWHVGQLIMAWIAALFLAAVAVLSSLAVMDSVSMVEYRADLADRDAIAREPANFKRISDSAEALHRLNLPIDDYVMSQGMQRGDFVGPTAAERKSAATKRVTLVYPLDAVALLLPLFMFWATWTWFGARAAKGRSAT